MSNEISRSELIHLLTEMFQQTGYIIKKLGQQPELTDTIERDEVFNLAYKLETLSGFRELSNADSWNAKNILSPVQYSMWQASVRLFDLAHVMEAANDT